MGNLENTDLIMNNTFWIGVFPGLTKNMINYVVFNNLYEFLCTDYIDLICFYCFFVDFIVLYNLFIGFVIYF